MFLFFDVYLRLAVEPFREITVYGSIRSFISHFPTYIRLCIWYGKPKIARSMTISLIQIRHWIAVRPDIVRFIGENCKWFTDLFIEHHNSCLCRMMNSCVGVAVTFAYVRFCGILLGSNRKLTKVLQCLLGTAKDDSDDPDNISPDSILRQNLGKRKSDGVHISEFQKMVVIFRGWDNA